MESGFYKEIDGQWYTGREITLPTGQVLTEEKRDNDEGWIWYDTAPREYIDYYAEKYDNYIEEE